jgi:SAM-dependent methyltransferase
MDYKKDAFGHEVYDYYKNKSGFELIERDDGYLDISSGPQCYFKQYKDWKLIEKKALKYVHGNILDVGAGVGRIALHLQNKHKILSIDNSPLAIKVCKLRGVKNAKLLSIDEINKLQKNSYDTIVMLGNNFGLFQSYRKAKILLKKMYKITTKDAVIIAQTNDTVKPKIPEHLNYQKRNIKKGRMPGQIRIRVRYGQYIGDWFDYLFVSKSEMEDILKVTGWKIKKYINSKTANYVAIIEKEKRLSI